MRIYCAQIAFYFYNHLPTYMADLRLKWAQFLICKLCKMYELFRSLHSCVHTTLIRALEHISEDEDAFCQITWIQPLCVLNKNFMAATNFIRKHHNLWSCFVIRIGRRVLESFWFAKFIDLFVIFGPLIKSFCNSPECGLIISFQFNDF